ncbi:S-adenosyl-L-methionine-dependent methyltransferase, partial [Trichocladium antarcticum]
MSAPSIPNLLSLRGPGGRGRGRGRGGPSRGSHPPPEPGPSHDAAIQGTDTDAAVSRLSAVELGYLLDPFARLFVQAPPGPSTRRLPIINRGTYTRTTAIDTLVDRFLATTDPDRPRQIISLGAGTDTRSLRLFASGQNHRNIAYHEIDFPAVTARKRVLIQSTPHLRALLAPPVSLTPTTFQTHPLPNLKTPATTTTTTTPNSTNNTLTIHGLDLRTLNPSAAPLPTLLPTAPTLLLSECCLCYLPAATAGAVLAHFSTTLASLGLVLYEPVLPHDAFGRTMTANLAARGIAMPTVAAYPTRAAQEARLRGEVGLREVRSETVEGIWARWVADGERARVDGLEGGLDEVEEWRLLAGHYVGVWGGRGGGWDLDV